jgi:uncharacterized protein YraI
MRDLWKQFPFLTKVYLVLLLVLTVVFSTLILFRAQIACLTQLPTSLFSKKDAATQLARITQTSTVTVIPADQPRVIASINADIRSGPGNEYSIIALLTAGQMAEVVGVSVDQQWWAIKVPYVEGGQGWVSINQVNAENTGGVQVVSGGGDNAGSQISHKDVPSVQAITNVKIRNGPGTNYNQIGVLQSGQAAEVVGVSPDNLWWAIKSSSSEQQGWVAADFVAARNTDNVPVIGPQAIQASSGVPTPASSAPFLTAITIVNIRSGPGTQFAVVGRLDQGQKAEVVGRSADGQWWAIKVPSLPEGIGWVVGGYVKVENADNVPVLK